MALTHHSNATVLGVTSDFRPFGGNESLTMSNETKRFLERTGNEEVMRFAGEQQVPMWLAWLYLGANVALTGLNWWWFEKMISAVRKRFVPQTTKKGVGEGHKVEGGKENGREGGGLGKEDVKITQGEGEKMANGGLGDTGDNPDEEFESEGHGHGDEKREEEVEEIKIHKGERVLEVLASSSIHKSSSSPDGSARSTSRPRRRHG